MLTETVQKTKSWNPGICKLVHFAGSEVAGKEGMRRKGQKKTPYSVCTTTSPLLGKEALTSTPCQENKKGSLRMNARTVTRVLQYN